MNVHCISSHTSTHPPSSPLKEADTLPLPITPAVTTSYSLTWAERCIELLDGFDHKLDHMMPNFSLQDKADQLAASIKNMFTPLIKFDHWLNSNGKGNWYQQLANFLLKLPVRSARNIVIVLYKIIEEALYLAVHPAKCLNHLLKLTVKFLDSLTEPETWTKIGAGTIGATCAFALIAGGPASAITLAIAGALILAGLGIGSAKTAYYAENHFQSAKENIIHQGMEIPETVLTGFYSGLAIGVVMHTVVKVENTAQHYNESFDQQWIEKYLQKEGLLDVIESYLILPKNELPHTL